MTRTLLIVIGILAAVLTAAGIMQFSSHKHSLLPTSDIYHQPNCNETFIIPRIRPVTYYEIIEPDKESIPIYKEWLKSKDEKMRQASEVVLKKLGLTQAEIQKAKEK